MRLTAKQEYVLRVLDGGDYMIAQWSAWYPLTQSQVAGIIPRLYNRSLVKPVAWRGNSRVWAITELGRDVLKARDRKEGE